MNPMSFFEGITFLLTDAYVLSDRTMHVSGVYCRFVSIASLFCREILMGCKICERWCAAGR